MSQHDPRTISTEGLLIEHYLLTLRRIELACRLGAFPERLFMMLRQHDIKDELERRELKLRRATA